MEKRKVILAAAVAGLVAAGSMAKISVAQAEEPAAKADSHGSKDSCGGKNSCGGKMMEKTGDKDKCSADKCHTDKCKGSKKVKKAHAKKHAAEKAEEKKAE